MAPFDITPSLDLLNAEIKYLEARGWRQIGPDAWEAPRPRRDGRSFRHGHAVNAQKQEDSLHRHRNRGVCGWRIGTSSHAPEGGEEVYRQCTLPRNHSGDHTFGEEVTEIHNGT